MKPGIDPRPYTDGIYTFMAAVVILTLSALFSMLFMIDPAREYGWWGGIWQGTLAIAHWTVSWFSAGCLIKAPVHTDAYNVWWWIAFIQNAIFVGLMSFRAVIALISSILDIIRKR